MNGRRKPRCVYKCLLTELWLLYFFAVICSPIYLAAQVNNTGGLYISGNVYAASNLTNASSAVYRNDGNLYLNRNFRNDQPSMVDGNGTTFFIGSALQQINGSQQPAFNHVNINNTAGVQMNVNTSMGGTISPVTGSLYFNGYTLTIGGAINTLYTNTEAFNVTSSSNLRITGNAATGNKLYFAASANTLHNLTLTAGATAILGNVLNITAGSQVGTVTVNGYLDAAGFLTLKSDTSATARVGSSGGTIIGEVTVERYFPAIRAWRFISVPFSSSSQSINQAWQEGYTDSILTCPPQHIGTPGYGTSITYNNVPGTGYDVHNTTRPSLKVYNNNMWLTPVSTLTTNIASPNTAYALFVRGDRSVCLTNATGYKVTTLRPHGVLNQFGGAAITRSFSGNTNDYILIDNPYASSVDIKNILPVATGIYTDKFWTWNPRLGGNNGVGGYVTFTLTGGIYVPNDTSYKAGTIIQNGQAFMIQKNSSGSGSLIFHEVDKSAIDITGGVFGLQTSGSNQAPPALFVNLLDTGHVLMDGIGAAFNLRYSAAIDSADVQKRWNEEIENIALIRGDEVLAIELRPVPILSDTLFLRMYLRKHPYVLQVFSQQLPSNLHGTAWIVDKYLDTQTEINLHDTTLYNFAPNSDTNSYRDRFMLVFQRKPSSPGQSAYATDETIQGNIKLYPNPAAAGDKIAMQFNNLPKGIYRVLITDITGKPIMNKTIEYMGDKGNYNIGLSATQASGEYIVRVINEHGFEYKTRFVIAY